MYSSKDSINILTALLLQYGVRHIVVCPGSRNAPLVHNFSECPDIICHPVTDERSAGFIALGIRLQTKEQVAVCVTSGSALLNVLPAAAEASYQHQGIIVISADRPTAWIDQLDGQTIPQPQALGSFVGKSVNLPEPHDMTEVWHCKRLVCEALMANMTAPYPSVHINVPISEPLFEFSKPELPDINMVIPCQWSDASTKDYLCEMLQQAPRPMMVLGQLPDDAETQQLIHDIREHAVVLCEQLASSEHTVTDQMLFALSSKEDKQDYQPSHVIFLGGHTISKRLRHFLRSLPEETEVMMVTEDCQLRDISQHATWLIEGDATIVLSDLSAVMPASNKAFHQRWTTLESDTLIRHNSFLPSYSCMLAVKEFEKHVTAADTVHYANSMSVRLGAVYANHYCYCNRGINGIEGSLSVAVGAAIANPSQKTYCVIGDLSFFYDENALWQQQLSGNFRILLLNNSQGGIFRNLQGLEQSPVRDSIVSARHSASAEGICQQFGLTYLRATDEPSLVQGIATLTQHDSTRPVLLEVLTDVNIDEQQYKAYYNLFK